MPECTECRRTSSYTPQWDRWYCEECWNSLQKELEQVREPIKSTHVCQGYTGYTPAACQRCGRRDGLWCILTDEIWARVSAAAGNASILCLWCIDELCGELGIETSVTLHFRGKHITGISKSETDLDHESRLIAELEELRAKKEGLKAASILILHFTKEHLPYYAGTGAALKELCRKLEETLGPLVKLKGFQSTGTVKTEEVQDEA